MRKRTVAAVLAVGVVSALAAASPVLAAGTWTVVNTPDPAGNTYAELNSVFTASGTQAWAVGEARGSASGDSFNALIERWNGSTWRIVPGARLGAPPSATTPLYGVSGSGPADVWAVGQNSNSNTSLIEHWDGSSWHLVASPPGEPPGSQLNAVSAASPTDAWAVGSGLQSGQPFTSALAEHWNGKAWSVVPQAFTGTSTAALISVAAISPSDAWALGYSRVGRSREPFIEHWNGSNWALVSLPVSGILNSISAVSAGDIWAVGQNGLTENWNGAQWRQVPNPNGSSADLFAVDALSADDVWAISLDGATTEQWNGTGWVSVPPAASIPAGFRVGGGFIWDGNSLSGVPAGPLFAVGGNGGGGNNEATILEQPQP